jgi:type I restriction enzyme S subunit
MGTGRVVAMTSHHAPESGPRRFKPYPVYKDSGVEWLGEIPGHWEAVPIRALARPGFKTFTDGDWIESPFIREEGIRLIQTGNVGVGEYREQGFRFVDEETFRAFRCTEVLPGDVLICRLADPVGRACLAPDLSCRMITSVDVCILKTPPTIDAGFVVFALSGSSYLSWMSGICRGGTRDRVSRSMLGSIRIQKAPYDEQRAIAAFLDRETARIDALVAKKERLIELLQEKRTALITRGVTKGLDPDVPMKDSGVEWLGEIPAHWEVKRLWHLTPSDRRIMYGIVLPGPNVEDGVPIVKGGDVSPERLRLDRLNRTTFEIESGYVRSRLRGGDLVYAIRGSIGEVAIVPDELAGANLTQDAARVAYTPATHGPWLSHALKSAAVFAQLEAGALGATIRGVNIRDLKRASIPVPPQVEQEAIARFLERETARTDALVVKVRDAIDRLKELRTALISAVVTGKIDVREEAA